MMGMHWLYLGSGGHWAATVYYRENLPLNGHLKRRAALGVSQDLPFSQRALNAVKFSEFFGLF